MNNEKSCPQCLEEISNNEYFIGYCYSCQLQFGYPPFGCQIESIKVLDWVNVVHYQINKIFKIKSARISGIEYFNKDIYTFNLNIHFENGFKIGQRLSLNDLNKERFQKSFIFSVCNKMTIKILT